MGRGNERQETPHLSQTLGVKQVAHASASEDSFPFMELPGPRPLDFPASWTNED